MPFKSRETPAGTIKQEENKECSVYFDGYLLKVTVTMHYAFRIILGLLQRIFIQRIALRRCAKKVLFMMEACIGDCSRPKYAAQCIPMDWGVKYIRGVYHKEAFWRNLTTMNMSMQKLVHESLANHKFIHAMHRNRVKHFDRTRMSISESCNPLLTVVFDFCKVFVHIKISSTIHIFTYSTLADIRSPNRFM